MNIDELLRLANWILKETSEVQENYQQVHGILRHNANRPNKRPLEKDLTELKLSLKSINLNQLSTAQINVLQKYEILNYLGKHGINFIKEIETRTGIDPVTATQNVDEAQEAIAEARKRAQKVVDSFEGIDLPEIIQPQREENLALLRIEFKEDASINNIIEWKSWAIVWSDISRGVSMALGKAPETIKVLGATRGSIILELGVACACAKLIAIIVNQIIATVAQFTQLEITKENLREKRLLNEQIEKAMNNQIKEIKDDGIKNITDLAEKSLENELNGEVLTALKKSVTKLFEFHQKGGGIDCIAPEEVEGNSDNELMRLRETIENLRIAQQELKRLTHNTEE